MNLWFEVPRGTHTIRPLWTYTGYFIPWRRKVNRLRRLRRPKLCVRLSGQPMFPGDLSFYPDPDARLTLPGRLASMLWPTSEEGVRPRW